MKELQWQAEFVFLLTIQNYTSRTNSLTYFIKILQTLELNEK